MRTGVDLGTRRLPTLAELIDDDDDDVVTMLLDWKSIGRCSDILTDEEIKMLMSYHDKAKDIDDY